MVQRKNGALEHVELFIMTRDITKATRLTAGRKQIPNAEKRLPLLWDYRKKNLLRQDIVYTIKEISVSLF